MSHAPRWSSALLLVVPLPAQEPAASRPEPAPVVWAHDLAATLGEARAAGQPVLVFFTASWCQPCKQLKDEVCSTRLFARTLAGHRFVMVDIDSEEGRAMKSAWEVQPIPDLRFVSARGVEIGGFVGYRPLTGVADALAQARQSEAREAELRSALGNPPAAPALMALAEHLLLRPTKTPALAVLDQVVAHGTATPPLAARAHWLAVGARLHPIGRPAADTLADAERRLARIDAAPADPTTPPYADAIRAWLQWLATLRAWSVAREQPGQRELLLSVSADAPLRATLAALVARCGGEHPSEAAADGLLIEGLVQYYSGDHAGGLERLQRFTRSFPQHRWHDEGVRFAGVCQRLLDQRAAASRPASRRR